MAAGAPAPNYPEIIGDFGPASSGGASLTQKVRVKLPDGTEVDAHAKFISDVNGAGIIEYGPWGAVAELLTSSVARAIGAFACDYRPVLLPAGRHIRLRNDRHPAPGLAIASETIKNAVDAVDGFANDIAPLELASLVLLHSLTQVGDHAGAANHIRAGDPPHIYSVDHASAFPAERAGGIGPVQLMMTTLVQARLAGDPAALPSAAAALTGVLSDAVIAAMIAAVPRQLLPADADRTRLNDALQQRRNVLPGIIGEAPTI